MRQWVSTLNTFCAQGGFCFQMKSKKAGTLLRSWDIATAVVHATFVRVACGPSVWAFQPGRVPREKLPNFRARRAQFFKATVSVGRLNVGGQRNLANPFENNGSQTAQWGIWGCSEFAGSRPCAPTLIGFGHCRLFFLGAFAAYRAHALRSLENDKCRKPRSQTDREPH